MVVTELALLHIADASQSLTMLRPSLAKIKSTLQRSAGHAFSLYQNSRNLLIVGTWDSVDAHAVFLQSSANKELLQLCVGLLEVEWMVHIDADLTDVKQKRSVRITAGPQQNFRASEDKDEVQGRTWAATLGDDGARFAGFEVAWAQDQGALQRQQDTGVDIIGVFEELDVD